MPEGTAALVLAGGRSSRLAGAVGLPEGGKASLPLQGRTLLERVVARVGAVVPRIVVVAATSQPLPPLPGVEVVRDSTAARGPLAGIADGLRALEAGVSAVVVVSCDVPLVSPALLAVMLSRLAVAEPLWPRPLWIVPEVGGHLQVLVSGLRPEVLPAIEAHLGAGRRDPRSLVAHLVAAGQAVVLPERVVREIDPGLASFVDIDTPRDLEKLGDLLAVRGET